MTGARPQTQKVVATRRMARGRLPKLLRAATAHRRSNAADTILAAVLTFVAGAVNAGGFLAIGQYTSHMTGVVSSIADHLVLGTYGLVGAGIVSLIAFMAGAATSAVLINWGRRNTRRKQYAYPIALEALLLLGFGVLGVSTRAWPGMLLLALPLLCFLMGLQNATITKLSGARIRTTHLTGMVTDIGIELGKLAYCTAMQAGLPTCRSWPTAGSSPSWPCSSPCSCWAGLPERSVSASTATSSASRCLRCFFCLPIPSSDQPRESLRYEKEA